MSLATVAIITLAGRMIESVSRVAPLIATSLLAALLVVEPLGCCQPRRDDYPDADAPFLILTRYHFRFVFSDCLVWMAIARRRLERCA